MSQKIPGNGLTYGMDVGMTLLPFIGNPTFDAASQKIMVPIDTVGTTTDAPDLFYADVTYRRTVNSVTTTYAWIVFGPAPGDVTLPALPAEVGDVMPQATDTITGSFAGMLESDAVAGWDAARPDVYSVQNNAINAPHPAASRIRESTSGLLE